MYTKKYEKCIFASLSRYTQNAVPNNTNTFGAGAIRTGNSWLNSKVYIFRTPFW